jgi:hypothetical protein
MKPTNEIIEAAIEGFEAQKLRIDARIAELRTMLDGKQPEQSVAQEPERPRRKISAAGRKRIAEAQRKRWAEAKKEVQSPKPKRKLSATGRKAMVAAAKKRWAAVRAAKAASAKTPKEAAQ